MGLRLVGGGRGKHTGYKEKKAGAPSHLSRHDKVRSKVSGAGGGVYQEKDISLGGRHGLPFLHLAVSTSSRQPPSMYSKIMIGWSLRHAPTNPTTLG